MLRSPPKARVVRARWRRGLRLAALATLRLYPIALLLGAGTAQAQPAVSVDLATTPTDDARLLRVHGSTGSGNKGVPVAGGFDCDGDGFPDSAMAAMQSRPLGRSGAG